MANSLGTALVTGASFGIGAVYADRLAKRGYDLILVARNGEKLKSLALRLTSETGRSVKVIPADLGDRAARLVGDGVGTTRGNAGPGLCLGQRRDALRGHGRRRHDCIVAPVR